MNIKDLRAKDLPQLAESLRLLQKEQFEYRMKFATGQLTQTHVLKEGRRNIAKLKTLITEKSGRS